MGILGNDGSLSRFMGIDIRESSIVPEFKQVPIKKHVVKGWMSKSYHRRIQKKWIKRFGFTNERCFIQYDNTIVTHPNNVRFLTKALERSNPGVVRATTPPPKKEERTIQFKTNIGLGLYIPPC